MFTALDEWKEENALTMDNVDGKNAPGPTESRAYTRGQERRIEHQLNKEETQRAELWTL